MKLLTLTGPSCSGKTTLLNELVANHGFTGLTSHTTRPPREGEIDGVDYYFVDEHQFQKLKMRNELIENVNFNGYHYGVSVKEVTNAIKNGKPPVLIVEPNGLTQIIEYSKNNNIELLKVFVDADLDLLIQRYLVRAKNDDFGDGETSHRHSVRIASIFKEHSEWGKLNLYDFKLYGYNKHTEEEYIKFVKERV